MACWYGGRSDDAARAKQESATEVAEVGFRAGEKQAERGGVLSGAGVDQVAFLPVEEAATGAGARRATHAAQKIRRSETDPGRAGARGDGDGVELITSALGQIRTEVPDPGIVCRERASSRLP